MKNKKSILKELEWDKKDVYEADAERLLEIMKKKRKSKNQSSKVAKFYSMLDKIRVRI